MKDLSLAEYRGRERLEDTTGASALSAVEPSMHGQSNRLKSSNLLLARLSDDDLDLLAPRMQRRPLVHGQKLFGAGEPIEEVWFPEDGIASITVLEASGKRTEVGIIGRDGFTTPMLLLGTELSPYDCMMQVDDGSFGQFMAADAFLAVVEESSSLRSLLLRYVNTFVVQIARSASTNAHQRLETRLARWC